MFRLNRDDFRGADVATLCEFVGCWERYYRGSVTISPTDDTAIDYSLELNIGANLTAQNVTRLLRWKDSRMLTHPKADGTDNDRVVRVLAHLDSLNQFRRGEVDRGAFVQTVAGIFPNGIVWQLFLFHIAQPWAWPIADQHVFRAYQALFDGAVPRTLDAFEQYRECFTNLAGRLPREEGVERVTVASRNKRLDNALMAYGQFLLAYDR